MEIISLVVGVIGVLAAVLTYWLSIRHRNLYRQEAAEEFEKSYKKFVSSSIALYKLGSGPGIRRNIRSFDGREFQAPRDCYVPVPLSLCCIESQHIAQAIKAMKGILTENKSHFTDRAKSLVELNRSIDQIAEMYSPLTSYCSEVLEYTFSSDLSDQRYIDAWESFFKNVLRLFDGTSNDFSRVASFFRKSVKLEELQARVFRLFQYGDDQDNVMLRLDLESLGLSFFDFSQVPPPDSSNSSKSDGPRRLRRRR